MLNVLVSVLIWFIFISSEFVMLCLMLLVRCCGLVMNRLFLMSCILVLSVLVRCF